MSRALLITVLCLVALLAGSAYFLTRGEAALQSSVSVAEALGRDTTGYRRATTPRPFSFPEDHGPHPGYKLEWWYLTGNLETDARRHFGYQLTLFRNALAPPDSADAQRASDWAADQLYMGHFALTDVQGEQFYAFERFSRAGADLAGAQAVPLRVWLEDWKIEGAADSSAFPMTIQAAQGNVAIDFTLKPTKPLVLQGDQGLSQKGEGAGNASYYYSYTRLKTTGEIRVGEATHDVQGLSWMDREWSTSALGEGQVGWDWFSLQLDDGRELMYYRIRNADGTASRYTEGVLVGPGGATKRLTPSDVELTVLDRWESPSSDAAYPVRWQLRVPSENLDFTVSPYLRDQELDVSVRYWEGAVRVEGTASGDPVTGSGYLEMTGYGENEAQPAS